MAGICPQIGRADTVNDDQIRTILSVMNMTAPKDTEWCASSYQNADYITDQYLIRDHWRFYLVEDASVLHDQSEGIIWAW